MSTSTVFVKYRPIKIGFLVEEGDINALVKAAGINTLLWGGIYNPIIPISQSNIGLANQLLKLFNVDILYKVSESIEIVNFYDKYPYLRDPNHNGEKIFYEDWSSKKNILAYLDSKNIVSFYWNKEFKYKSKRYKSNCLLVDWEATDKYSNLFSLMFGCFPNSYNLKDNYRDIFEKGLKSKATKLDIATTLPKDLLQSITPISATGLELYGYGGSLSENGIYIGEEGSFIDLINFWNIRASGIRIKFLPKDNFSKFETYIQSYLLNIDKSPNTNPNFPDFVNIYYQGNHDGISSIIKNLKLKNKSFCLSSCGDMSWNGLNIKPKEYYFKHERSLGHIEKRYGNYSLSFVLPEKKFLTESTDNSQSLITEINPISDTTHPGYTFKLPYIHELNEFYSREICFNPWTLRISPNGVGIFIKSDESDLKINPIPHEKVIHEIFKLSGFDAELDQAGLLAEQIITKMKENYPLEACRVFKIRSVRSLLKYMNQKKVITWSEGTNIIWDKGSFSKFEKLYSESRDKSKLNASDTLNFLIKKNIIQPQLKLLYKIITPKKEFKCRKCGLKGNIPISSYVTEYVCKYCLNKHSMPQYIKDDLQGVVNKYFRFYRSGLFSKDNNQEGAIPVILTLLTLQRVLHDGNLFYSTSTTLKGQIKCEVDFSVLNIENSKIEFGIAECKSDGQEINKIDIDNLKVVQDKMDEIGVDCYVIFSKTNDMFTNTEMALFKELKTQQRKFILLTNKELEPYEPYWELEETDNLPRKYAHNLEDMYYNSLYLYLRD